MSQNSFRQLADRASILYKDFEGKLSATMKEAVQIIPSRKDDMIRMGEDILKSVDADGTSLSTLVAYDKFEREFLPSLSDESRRSFSESRKLASSFGRAKQELQILLDDMEPDVANSLKNDFAKSSAWLPSLVSIVGDKIAEESDDTLPSGASTDGTPAKESVYKVEIVVAADPALLGAMNRTQVFEEFLFGSSEMVVRLKAIEAVLEKMGISVDIRGMEKV